MNTEEKHELSPELKAVNAVDEAVDKIIQEISEEKEYCEQCDELIEEGHICFTCCNVEITQEIKDVGLCPKCLEHI